MNIYIQLYLCYLWAIGIVVSFILFLRKEKIKEYFWNSGFMVAIWPIRLLFSVTNWLYRGWTGHD